jgi:hypothetical protein
MGNRRTALTTAAAPPIPSPSEPSSLTTDNWQRTTSFYPTPPPLPDLFRHLVEKE